MSHPNSIDPHMLWTLIGSARAPTILDVCIDADFTLDPRLVPGSRRVSHQSVADGTEDICRDRPIVVVCQKGRKLSQGVAALLRNQGLTAVYLIGGQIDWCAADLPLVTATAIPKRKADGRTLWVTGSRPSTDALASCWLIRRFVDVDAAILFVAPEEVIGVANRFDATPFAHNGAMSASLATDLGLHTAELERMCAITEGADAPETAGVEACCAGLSHCHDTNLALMDAALPVFDAVYAWARCQTDGFQERAAP